MSPLRMFDTLLHGTAWLPLDGFWWNLMFETFSKICQEIQVSLKSNENNGYFTWRLFTFMTLYHKFLRRMRTVSFKSCRENKKHFIFSDFFSKNCAVYEIMSKNMVEPETDNMVPTHGILNKWAYMRARTRLCLRTCCHAPTHACARTHTHTHTHTHTDTDTRTWVHV
jgi:hypothetical protein